MAYTGPASGAGYAEPSGWRAEAREPGARRRKLAGYLKAANELRQTYFNQEGVRDGSDESGVEGPGAFPDAAVVRSGNEEMVLFPSYGRKHTKSKYIPTPGQEINEQDYWQREWDRHQDSNAVVDVDVRGWIYTPHRGQTNRKQRLMIGLARQMCGIPAPTATRTDDSNYASSVSSRATSPQRPSRMDEEYIAREAENLVRKGEQEERYARRGAFSEKPVEDRDGDSVYAARSGNTSRNTSPDRSGYPLGHHRLSQISMTSSVDGDPGTLTPPQKRASWSQPAKMGSTEVAIANAHLLTRLKPFMANPLANTPIQVFFYNDDKSRSHTAYTNASGHFSFRGALDFVPTHVRVLAGEKLSATEEVKIISPKGVSLISDIDDTIKHSAISSGAREIFRNAFIRELGDLTIEGVREWYNTLHDMGVSMHYVSNSPWQMYPVLTSYFKLAHLPKGSFHLKQYTGMLQGIFEPVAERKKSSLEKIMRDFADRKFILVGDSGEADLEVYTDVAIENPGRVLGIFIRDVTTPVKTGYFDSSNGMAGSGGHSRHHSRHRSGDTLAMSKRLSRPGDIRDDDADLKAAIAASLADMEEETRRARRSINPDSPSPERAGSPEAPKVRPHLPPRRSNDPSITHSPVVASPEEDLIDFSEDLPTPNQPFLAPPPRNGTLKQGAAITSVQSKPSPSPPPKPQGLRSPSPSAQQQSPEKDGPSKTPPPRPRKPSSAVKPPSPGQIQTWTAKPTVAPPATSMTQHQPSPLSQVTPQSPEVKGRPPLPARPRTYIGLVKGIAKPHNSSSLTNYWQSDAATGQPRSQMSGNSYADSVRSLSTASAKSKEVPLSASTSTIKAAPPPPPRRRPITSYSTSTRKATNRLSGGWDDGGGGSLPGSPGEAGMSKKEFLWMQRWARAKSVLDRQGVTLRSWRVGSDVADVCVKLAEYALRDIEKGNQRERKN